MTYRSAKRPLAALVLLVQMALSGSPAQAQVESREGIALQNQILELRRQIQSLQDQSGRGGGSPTYLGRGTDNAGRDFWANQLTLNGGNIELVAEAFISSTEYFGLAPK